MFILEACALFGVIMILLLALLGAMRATEVVYLRISRGPDENRAETP